ncbi:MAG: hypothetical protein ACI4CY_06565 [Candidatus Gastranaerophilaceae bacterium]
MIKSEYYVKGKSEAFEKFRHKRFVDQKIVEQKTYQSHLIDDGELYRRRTGDTRRKNEVSENSAKKQEKRMARIEACRVAKSEPQQVAQNLDVNV